MKKNILHNVPLTHELFGKNMVLFDSVNELFELELALLESKALSKEELIQRTAFFKHVQSPYL